jgi:hypothetical protein
MINPLEQDLEKIVAASQKIVLESWPKRPGASAFRWVTSDFAPAQWLASRSSLYYVHDNWLDLPESWVVSSMGGLPGSAA